MFLVLMEFNQDIIDIREQFPLTDYDETYSIVLQKNIRPAYILERMFLLCLLRILCLVLVCRVKNQALLRFL